MDAVGTEWVMFLIEGRGDYVKIKSRYDAYTRGKKILADYDALVKRQDEKKALWDKEGTSPKRETVDKMEHELKIQRQAAQRELAMLKTDYSAYLNEASKPFAVIDGRIVAPCSNELNFLSALEYIRLTPEQIQFYGNVLRSQGNRPMCAALAKKCEEWGYKTENLVMDPEKEMQKFDAYVQGLQVMMEPVNVADYVMQTKVYYYRTTLDETVEASMEFDSKGDPRDPIVVTKIPQTVEEELISIALKEGNDNKPADDFATELQATEGFWGKKAAEDLMIAESKAQAGRVSRDREASEDPHDTEVRKYKQQIAEANAEQQEEIERANEGSMAFGARK